MRKAGILLPITSLPSKYGIGCFSKSAYDFIDWLSEAGQSYWQVLPMGPTSFGDSPYQSPSAFAGNPYFISLEDLIDDGELSLDDCEDCDFGDNPTDINYEKIYNERFPLLKKAFNNFKPTEEYHSFTEKSRHWLDDYSLFMAIKDHFDGLEWYKWPEDIRMKQPESITKYKLMLEDEIRFWCYLQFKFYKQWYKLKKYANEKGIKIIGDIPIYASMDSSDVWSNPELFQLDEKNVPIAVAGCPPDGFSPTGQLWGNPLYNWKNHKQSGYSWWIKRLGHCFRLYDIVRIDHFRGFDEYYSIPYGMEDATIGQWEKGPGIELFRAMENALGKKDVIAEDLGFITDSVKELLAESGYAGIKVLEFAFDERDTGSSNDYLPHNYPENCVAYTGTHDNQTLISWFETISDEEKNLVRNYICDKYTPDELLHLPLISVVMMSVAKICIIPIQDYLGYRDDARINTPSTLGTNWRWRLNKTDLSDELKKTVLRITRRYGRI